MRDASNEAEVLLGQMAVKVAHLEAAVERLEREYTRLARFVPVEKAVFSIIGILAVALIGIAVQKLFGVKP